MSNAHSSNSRQGAVPVGPPSRRKWLLPLLLALLALIAALFLLSRCGGDDDTSPTAGASTTPTATSAATSAPSAATSGPAGGQASAAAAGDQGTVTAGGTDLLGDTAGLGTHEGEPAVASGVRVQSVPADEGFWVGASEADRLWVQLTGTGGESDYKVKQGDTIDFTGTVTRAAQGFAAEKGVTAAEGAGQLTEQGHYLSVPASAVRLSD